MPIIFIHSGYSSYLEFSLRQARAADPETDIVLLGDAENDRFPFIRHVDTNAAPYREAAEAVEASYQHYSTNRRAFEVVCFKRWFLLDAFMKREGLRDALVLDSDVMLYASEAEVRGLWLDGQTLGVDRPVAQANYRWITSAGVSYWTAESLESFCDFILRAYTEPALQGQYREKWEYHLQHGLVGGICDMTALHLFVEGLDPASVVNFSDVMDGVTCDQNFTTSENLWPDEYRMDGSVKEMAWDEQGRPQGYNLRLDQWVRFQALHFAGKSKALMPHFYRGPAFGGQARVKRGLIRHYAARRLASAVLQPLRMLAGKLRSR